MTPADQDVERVVAAQARCRNPAQELLAEVRARMGAAMPPPPGGAWTPAEVTTAAAAWLAQALLDERAERLRAAGRVHNLAGDLGEFLTRWTADDLSDFGLVQQVETVIDLLEKQVAALKEVRR